jgi:hypothetical protein
LVDVPASLGGGAAPALKQSSWARMVTRRAATPQASMGRLGNHRRFPWMREVMMLSQDNRRTLAEIEQALRASDPELARKLGDFGAAPPGATPRAHPDAAPPAGRRRARRRVAALVGIGIGVVLLATAVVQASADALVLAVTVLISAAAWWISGMLVRRIRRASERHNDRW